MTGALWAVGSGLGFGLFQSLNRRALAGMDVALSTFIQLFVSAIVLTSVSLLTEDVGLIASAPVGALLAFGFVGLIHFFLGWTLLNLGQKLIGAARTGPLLATTPLFGAVLAAIWLQEVPGVLTVGGMVLTVTGVLVLSTEREAIVESPVLPDDEGPGAPNARSAVATIPRTRRRAGILAALGTALCWAVSPIFIREGLEGLPSPLLGVTVSMVASAVVFGVVLAARRRRLGNRIDSRTALGFKLAAGLLVGLSTWMRWIALDLTTVAVVLSVNSISVPTVLLLAPLVVGRHHERVTPRLWLGAALVIAGSLMLILKGS
ncbi:MAG: DMT family transporter [Actinomycetota bacterium]